LIAALDDSVDPSARRDLLQQIQRKLAADAVNGFLFQYPRLDIWNSHLHEVGFHNVLGVVDVTRAHFDGDAHIRHEDELDADRAASSQTFKTAGVVLCAAGLGLLFLVARRFGSVFVAQRLLVLAATLLAATVVVFVIVQVVPGDPVRNMMGLQADPDSVAALRHQWGLDAGPGERYLAWTAGLLRGDFGSSYTYRVPVRALIAERLQVSLPLAIYALLISTALAFFAALYSAARRGKTGAAIVGGMTQLGLAIPNFWLGILLVLVFALRLHWVSAGGFPGWEDGFWTGVKALTLPAIALAMPQAAILARVLRGALLEALREDYIRTARAQGAGEWRVLTRHALPNALVPVLTILGLQFSFLLAGGVIIENVFFLPGLGRLVFQAIAQRDLIVVQSVVVVLVFAVVSVTFMVDLGYVLVNPQLRGSRSA
jgi:peptide/nickel transport system substrate-binding protein